MDVASLFVLLIALGPFWLVLKVSTQSSPEKPIPVRIAVNRRRPDRRIQ